MLIPLPVIDIISKASPFLGSLLGGPAGGLVGSVISSVLGVDMKSPEEVEKKVSEDKALDKLKEIESQISDIQMARQEASKETGFIRFVRPFLALVAMSTIFINILLIRYVVDDETVKQILIVMMIFLVWDIRQIYKFYFGKGENMPEFLLRKK